MSDLLSMIDADRVPENLSGEDARRLLSTFEFIKKTTGGLYPNERRLVIKLKHFLKMKKG